jgi:3-hydroxyisobutyrate dehydrogenase-like beta-hydroxyacid dehydrogenase
MMQAADLLKLPSWGVLPKYGHKVPILIGGPAASDVAKMLAPYGMNLTDLGPEYGRAAATKMFRSIMVKGLEALHQECVLGADKYGTADQALASVGDGYPGIDWAKLADDLIGRTAIHGARRADEMDQVASTLRELDIGPFMASAASKRIRWAADQGLKDTFGNNAPESFHDVLAALKQK